MFNCYSYIKKSFLDFAEYLSLPTVGEKYNLIIKAKLVSNFFIKKFPNSNYQPSIDQPPIINFDLIACFYLLTS